MQLKLSQVFLNKTIITARLAPHALQQVRRIEGGEARSQPTGHRLRRVQQRAGGFGGEEGHQRLQDFTHRLHEGHIRQKVIYFV